MQTYQPKESPVLEGIVEQGTTKRQYYSADEAMAFLEPRIRAMFKYLGNNQFIGHHLELSV